MSLFYEPTPEQIANLGCQWCASYSGGKDSTSLVTWLEWLRRTGQLNAPTPKLVQSDTLVEDPALSAISAEMMALLRQFGWECVVVRPLIHEKMYNRILGIGNSPVHPGGRKMRWCTARTKIEPMDRWRKANDGGLTLTGLRLGESTIRDGKLKKRGCQSGGECGIPDPGEGIYSPLLNWRTCQVIDWLSGLVGKDVQAVMSDVFALTKKLVGIYSVCVTGGNFDFGEPEVKAARFGCIGCPAISATSEAPKSVILRNGEASPLNELYDVWFEARRRVNRCVRFKNGKDGYGPIRMEARKQLFARVMDIQRRAGVTLVSPEDEAFIRDCWARNVYPRGWSEADEATKPRTEQGLFVRVEVA